MSDSFGTIDPQRLGTGQRDGTKFLRDDSVWDSPFQEHVNRTGADSSHWTNTTAFTNIFPSGQDEFAAESDSTYLFLLMCRLLVTATGPASQTLFTQLAGTATYGNVSFQTIVGQRDIDGPGLNSWHGWRTAATSGQLAYNIPTTATHMNVRFEGTIDVVTAGTIIPQLSWTLTPGSVTLVKRGALWRMRQIGSAGMTIDGDFS